MNPQYTKDHLDLTVSNFMDLSIGNESMQMFHFHAFLVNVASSLCSGWNTHLIFQRKGITSQLDQTCTGFNVDGSIIAEKVKS